MFDWSGNTALRRNGQKQPTQVRCRDLAVDANLTERATEWPEGQAATVQLTAIMRGRLGSGCKATEGY